jgi:branched-subunit amino acid ABC-type transport system permease component
VNQNEVTLFMATIGLSFFLEGLAQLTFRFDGAQARARHRGCPVAVDARRHGHRGSAIRPDRSRHLRVSWYAGRRCLFSKTKIGRSV